MVVVLLPEEEEAVEEPERLEDFEFLFDSVKTENQFKGIKSIINYNLVWRYLIASNFCCCCLREDKKSFEKNRQ